MDGVLLDSRPVVERTWRRWAERHGLSAEPILRIAHGRRTWDTLRAAVPELATRQEVAWLDAAELEDFDGIVPIPGAVALVASLHTAQWTVVTSAGRELAARRLAVVGITLPSHAVTSEDVERGKPAPDGYLLAATRLGMRAEDCLVVEDAPSGVQAGRAAGARVLAVTTTHTPEALEGADNIVPDLRSLQVTASALQLEVLIDSRPGAT
jgi:mannitol-1-/sugar-/sorbitol-6-phosphatase